jgi:DNA mismatch repair protein MutL
MPKINILPKEIYQLIAAGEVVERPSSIVKEMIENSIDAGAQSITVEIKNGGSVYIRVTDDGCGIERGEVKKVFVSHATSKISSKEDLTSIGTLGFRGEAMASIAAVARVELLTRARGENTGTRYEIAGGEEISLDDAGCPEGTTIVVRDLFFNTPARMKFLKKDVTEGNSVAGIVERMAISHPDISFRFIRDGKQTLITSGNGDLHSAVYSVFGREVSEGLIPVDYSYEGMRISGYTSKPISTRKTRAMQFFFINGRLVESRTAQAALMQAYQNLIMVGRFPMCILNIELNPSLVDVNVHPAKIEVRFANEKPIFDLIYYGVKNSVEQDRSVKEADFTPSVEEVYARQPQQEKTFHAKLEQFRKKEEPPVQQSFQVRPDSSFWQHTASAAAKTSEYEVSSVSTLREEPEKPAENAPAEETVAVPDFRLIGEAFKTYLIVEIDNELYFIDKHAAHERMNYEAFRASATVEVQMLLSPAAVNLSKDELNAITENIDLLAKCGFEVEEFGDSAVLVRAVPSLVGDDSVTDLILEIAQKLLEHKTDIEPDKIDWIYHSASCRGAVKGGDTTSLEEQELFVRKLLSMPDIRFCPHGRPVFIKISRYDIEKQFGRV